MSQQAFWLFLKMDKRNLFVQMALQCAPVLAGIKVSNLLIIEESCTAEKNWSNG